MSDQASDHGTSAAVVLCADDFGIDPGTSRSIAALAEAGRVSATSCMANASAWPGAAPSLLPLAGRIGIGLHLTLTWGRPLGPMPGLAPGGAFPPLGEVLRKSLLGGLDRTEIEAEIARQLAAFRAALGRDPDFVDGHQHVHVLPGIRGALLRVLETEGVTGAWLRDPSEPFRRIARRGRGAGKAAVVAGLARGFARDAARAGFRTNRGFSGFSAFDPAGDYRREMEAALSGLGPSPLVMCHPGLPARDRTGEAGPERDVIAASRPVEQAYLVGPDFAGLLARRELTLRADPA